MSESESEMVWALGFTKQDGFVPLDKNPLMDVPIPGKGDAVLEALHALGYEQYCGILGSYGSEADFGRVQVYLKKGSADFIVDLDDACGSIPIFVSGLANLFTLHERLIPLITALNIDWTVGNMHRTARRAFRAWHGHEADQICPACDPYEVRDRREHVLENRRKAQEMKEQEQKASEVKP